jgi:predicted PurR-regulated permease PerM
MVLKLKGDFATCSLPLSTTMTPFDGVGETMIRDGTFEDAGIGDAASIAREPSLVTGNRSLVTTLATIERSVSFVRIIPTLAVLGSLWWGQVVLIPIVLAILISYALEPAAARLEACRIPRAIAAPFVMVTLVMTVASVAYGLRTEVVAFVTAIPPAAHTVSEAIQAATRGAPGTIANIQAAARELETATRAVDANTNNGVTPVRVEEPTFKWSNWLWTGSRNAGELAGQLFIVLCLTYYLLAAGDLYKRKLVRLAPTLTEKKITVQILADIDRQIERFLLARVALCGIVGSILWLIFRSIGLENAGVWGVLSAVLFAIPYVGPTVVVVGAGLAGFVQFGSIEIGLAIAGACLLVAAVEGNVITPWLMSRAGEMNAVAVFVSLLFWGWIWGFWGLLLAVPITGAVKVVCERIPDLQTVAELLKD